DKGQLVAGRDLRMGRQGLLDQGRARARETEDEDRLWQIVARLGAWHDAQPRRSEKAARAVDELARLLVEIDETADLAAEALAFGKGGKGFRVTSHLVEQPAFFEELVGAESAVAVLPGDRVEQIERLLVGLDPAEHDRARQQDAGVARREFFGALEQFGRALEVAVGFLHPRPAEQGLQ